MVLWTLTQICRLRATAHWIAAVSALFVVACSSTNDAAKKALNPDPPAKMYADADAQLNRGSYSDAAKRFEDLDRDHPYSPEARRAMVMAAYAYYKAGKYPEAQVAGKRYTTMHPGTKDAALAHHIVASANFDEIRDPQRDQTATRKAHAELKLLVQRYPDSPYGQQAINRIRISEDMLAASEMNVGRYYLNRKNYVGAINRFKTVVAEYQTTPQVEEALYRIAEANMTLGIVPEAQAASAVLGHNYPSSEWYKRAHALLKSGGVSPDIGSGNWFTKTLKSLAPGGKAQPKPAIQPKAPDPGMPSPDSMPAPKEWGAPTVSRTTRPMGLVRSQQ